MELKELNDKFVLEGKVQCHYCGGTGIYQGMCEKDGAAVICSYCEGKGFKIIKNEYTKFTGLKINPKVKRVYSNTCGFVITDKDVTSEGGELIEFSKFGIDYDTWYATKKTPIPIKTLICPYLETKQEMQRKGHDVNDLYKKRCSENLAGAGCCITACKMYNEKGICWQIFEGKIEA